MNKFMRIVVYFDLPVKKANERKAATKFRNFLLKDGYDMVQFSVYSRICCGMDAVRKYKSRLKLNIPEKGSIIVFTMTEKEYESKEILLGTPKFSDSPQALNLIEFF
jgi:CRISPR-associated protein Cas2